MRIIALLVLLVSPLVSVYSQKTANPERVKQLKPLPYNKNAKVSAYRYSSLYTFKIEENQLHVLQEDTVELISLQGNVDYIRHVFYNDNVSVIKNDVRYANGKTLRKETLCGNHEIEDIFYSDAKICSYKFNFLHEGTEISFKSRLIYNDPKYLTSIFFQDDLPVSERFITFHIPQGVSVELVEKNFEGYGIKKEVAKQDTKTVYRYAIKSLKPIINEPHSQGVLHHYPHIVVLTKDYTTASGKQNVLSSTDDLYKWYAGLVREVKNDVGPFKDQVQKLTANAKTPEEKIKAIYYWVQDNIKYIAFEDGIAGFKPEAAQNVYTNRYGDCKGMANLTKEMLKVAGFDARLTWIGTSRIPYTYDLPTLAVDNHMICTISLADKFYILDPTEKFVSLGSNAERIQGKEMMIENGDKYILKKVPVTDHTSNLVSRTETVTLEGNVLKGQGQLVLNGETKKDVLYISANVKVEDQKKVFQALALPDRGTSDHLEITNTPVIDRDKPLEIKYSYVLANRVSEFEKDLYVELDWNKIYGDLEMPEDRETDYYFNKKVRMKISRKLKLPPGYKVTHLPKPLSKRHTDFNFDLSFKQTGQEVIYTNEITIHKGLIRKSDFTAWNSAIKELKELYNDNIIITKTR